MSFCNKCGNEILDNASFCNKCGATLNQTAQETPQPQQPQYQQTQQQYQAPQQQPYQQQPNYNYQNQQNFYAPPKINTTGYLIWSILTLILCCWPLGIVGIVFVNKAKSCMSEEEAKKTLKNAMLFNIIGDAVGFVVILIYIIVAISNS